VRRRFRIIIAKVMLATIGTRSVAAIAHHRLFRSSAPCNRLGASAPSASASAGMSHRNLIPTIVKGVIVVLAGAWFAFFSGETQSAELDPQLWDQYRSRFMTGDGRVIDKDNDPKGVTHTEGQGYGMLLAEAAGDRDRFELLWRWTPPALTGRLVFLEVRRVRRARRLCC
jgi:Glycosyl hydrolases family 8